MKELYYYHLIAYFFSFSLQTFFYLIAHKQTLLEIVAKFPQTLINNSSPYTRY